MLLDYRVSKRTLEGRRSPPKAADTPHCRDGCSPCRKPLPGCSLTDDDGSTECSLAPLGTGDYSGLKEPCNSALWLSPCRWPWCRHPQRGPASEVRPRNRSSSASR